MTEMKENGLDEFTDKIEEYKDQIAGYDSNIKPFRDFTAKYALIYANEKYDKLRKTSPKMADIKQTKNDLMNALATVSMMDIPRENIMKLVDCSKKELDKVWKDMYKKVKQHEKEDEYALIYAYVAGHGVADTHQYFVLNSEDTEEAQYPIEKKLRFLSE